MRVVRLYRLDFGFGIEGVALEAFLSCLGAGHATSQHASFLALPPSCADRETRARRARTTCSLLLPPTSGALAWRASREVDAADECRTQTSTNAAIKHDVAFLNTLSARTQRGRQAAACTRASTGAR